MLLPRRKKKEKKKASPGLENQKKKEEAMLQKKEKRRQCYLLPRGEGKKKIKATWRAHVHVPMSIFVNKKKIHPHSIFSSFWEENILVDSRRKHLDPTIYFSFFLPNQTHSKKVFLPIFFPKFSIYHVSSPNKHTLKVFV